MTKEENVKNLLTELIDMIDNGSQRDLDRADEISKSILNAIEQEPILDKIKAEIMQLDYGIETIGFDLNDMPADEMVHTICREEVLKIIDKYKAKGEVEK